MVESEDAHTYVMHNAKAATSSRLTVHQMQMSCAMFMQIPSQKEDHISDYSSCAVHVHGKPELICGKQDTCDLIVSALEVLVITGACMRGRTCKQYLKGLSRPQNRLVTPQAQLSHVCQLRELHPELAGQSWD